jgi:hypothetical protein
MAAAGNVELLASDRLHIDDCIAVVECQRFDFLVALRVTVLGQRGVHLEVSDHERKRVAPRKFGDHTALHGNFSDLGLSSEEGELSGQGTLDGKANLAPLVGKEDVESLRCLTPRDSSNEPQAVVISRTLLMPPADRSR